jgi:hypothetical protein
MISIKSTEEAVEDILESGENSSLPLLFFCGRGVARH